LLLSSLGWTQGKFKLPLGETKDKIRFDLINNLVIIPVEINGVELNFLLDTGVNATILFSLENRDSIQLNNTKVISLKGLGDGLPIEALKSSNNTLKIGNAINRKQVLYIIFDESLNFSPRLGETIHGIIGYDFFKDFVVKTNYVNEFIEIEYPETYVYKNCRRCFETQLFFYRNKPYINVDISTDNGFKEVTLLLDSGSGDALWLFNDREDYIKIPEKYFDDFLGLGLNGNIFGKRSKIEGVGFGNFKLSKVNVAYPNEEMLSSFKLFLERDGSLGGEILRRFTTIIDYRNNKFVLKKNRYFNDPFYYNMSGLTIQHNGFEYVKEKVSNLNKSRSSNEGNTINEVSMYQTQRLFEIRLAPKYEISEVRKNSPAEEIGLQKGDMVLSINGKPAHRYTLEEINSLFYTNEGRLIRFVVDRYGVPLSYSFKLRKVIE